MKEKNYKSIIDNIVNLYQEKLNDWEIKFISSVYQWHVLDGKPLSEPRKTKILEINRELLEGRR